MPTVNIFYKETYIEFKLNSIKNDLKDFIARELTCGDIKLKPDEVSVRLINIKGDGMIGEIEVEVTASSFKERVEKQDLICLNIAKYMKEKDSSLGEVKVWLILAELGHSWE